MKPKTWTLPAVLLLALLVTLSACAGKGYDQAPMLGKIPWPPTEYKHTISTTALRQYWNCTKTGDVMRLDGLAANIWNSQPVRFMEWTLAGVDNDGRTVSSATVDAKVLQLWANQYTTYQIDLQTKGTETRFNLYYTYQFWDTGKDNPIVAGLDWDGPVLLAQQNSRWFVLDACSDTQHLVR
jgi:hypothetical protein